MAHVEKSTVAASQMGGDGRDMGWWSYPPSSEACLAWEKQHRTLYNAYKLSKGFVLRNRDFEELHGENCSLPTEQLASWNYQNCSQKARYWKSRQGEKAWYLSTYFFSSSQIHRLGLSSEKSGCLEGLETWMEKEDGSWACLKHSIQVVGMFT